ncbi:MAG: class B sortase [Clostridia bacterium]|nr:class B sortase [Clostridia bacterium]
MRKKQITESVLRTQYNEGETALTASLGRARPADMSKTPVDTKDGILKKAAKGGVRYMIMIACFLVFLGTCLYLLIYTIQYFQKQEENRFLQNFIGKTDYTMASIAEKDTQNIHTLNVDKSMGGQTLGGKYTVDKKVYNEPYEKMKTVLNGLRRINSDVWGWIKVPNTSIDYVVLRAADNDYYLYRSFTKEYNRSGSIFADYRTRTKVEDNRNLIIYGHNMNTTKTMFYPLLEYATNEDVFNKRLIEISTLDGIYTYSVFSVYDTSTKFNYIKTYFSTDEEYVDFLKTLEKKSVFHKDVELNADSRILTLSTCTVRQDNRRWAIHAVLVGISN